VLRLARRASSILLSATLLIGLVWGCASTSTQDGHPGGNSSGGATDASSQGDRSIKLDGDLTDSGPLGLNPLCGVQPKAGCIPDIRQACSGYVPPPVGIAGQGNEAGQGGQSGRGGPRNVEAGSGAGGVGARGGSGGVDASIGSGGDGAGEAGQGGEAGAAGEAGSAGQGGMSQVDAGVDAGAPLFGCQVTTQDGMPVAACAASGHGGVDAPCTSSGDCQAGLACVNNNSAIPECRPFCCQGDALCGSGTYCAERPLRDDRAPDAGPPTMVPVCVAGTDCDLATPYPCPVGTDCVCTGNTACTVVRSGTTACVVPGTGQANQPCPCAFGYVCSADASACLKLCLVAGDQSCGTSLCQSVAGLPQGWGVCIGDSKPD
jgi:hypothetical protein